MGRTQAVHFRVHVIGCQVADGKDGDEAFLQWRRGLKDKNAGNSGERGKEIFLVEILIFALAEPLPLKDGGTCEAFAPIELDCTLSKDSSQQWETKYLSISVKLVSSGKEPMKKSGN